MEETARRKEHLHKNSYEDFQKQFQMRRLSHLGLCWSLALLDSHHLLTSSGWGGVVALFASSILNKGLKTSTGIFNSKRENSSWAGAPVLMFALLKFKYSVGYHSWMIFPHIEHSRASEPQPERLSELCHVWGVSSLAGRFYQSQLFVPYCSVSHIFYMLCNKMYSNATVYRDATDISSYVRVLWWLILAKAG